MYINYKPRWQSKNVQNHFEYLIGFTNTLKIIIQFLNVVTNR